MADEDIDHYAELGLPSGEEASKLTLKDIEKAYRNESRKRHPDKRLDDPNATADFQRLTSSYNVLCDASARAALDARLRARRDRVLRESHQDAKRRRFATDLEERERAAEYASSPAEEARRREKKAAADIKRELAEFKARNFKRPAPPSAPASGGEKGDDNQAAELDKEKVLKVTWERDGGDYTAAKLRELFQRFGPVEDVVIRLRKKKGSAVVVMSSKDSVLMKRESDGLLPPSRSKPSLAAVVSCMMPFMLGVCFLCPSMDCLWHKYHYCPSCGNKVADFEKSDPCLMLDQSRWMEHSFAVPA